MIKSRAAVAWEAKRPMVVEEVDVEGPEEICTRPFQLVTGRVWKGSAFGGVKGRSELPGFVDRYMDGEFSLDTFITNTMPLERVNDALELMHAGKSIRTVIRY